MTVNLLQNLGMSIHTHNNTHTFHTFCSLCREVTDVANQIHLLPTHTCTHAHTHSISQHRDPDKLETTSNEAYNVVRRRAGSDGVEEVVYETPQFLSLPTSSHPATAAGDYELI